MKKNALTEYLTKGAFSQGAGAVVSASFRSLMYAIGLPEAEILTPMVQGAAIGVVNYCYDDFASRLLSTIERKKIDIFSQLAMKTFFEFSEENGVTPMQQQIEEGQLQYAYEVAENAMLTAIRQSELAKVEVLGRYFGSQLYMGRIDWQDMHQMITMAGSLTLRQLIMIRLIADEFEGLDTNLFIGNPSACVEINRLKDYGIWQTEGAAFGINESCPLQLGCIIPTHYSEQVCESLMLDRLSQEDIERTIESLRLTSEGSKEKVLTEENYNRDISNSTRVTFIDHRE